MILKETRLLLDFIGLMPSFYPKKYYQVLTTVSLINLIWISLFQVPYFFKPKDMTEFSDVLSLFSEYVMLFLRCILFLYHNRRIQKFILVIEENVEQSKLFLQLRILQFDEELILVLQIIFRNYV